MTQPLKRVGARVVQVCEIVDRLKVCGSGAVHRELGIDRYNVRTYLQRAVGMGLIKVDRTARLHTFRTTPGWREIVARRPEPVRIAVVPMLSGAMMAQRRSFPLAGVWV